MRLFVSVGTQLPFERLLEMVNLLSLEGGYEVVYQIAESNFTSENGQVFKYIDPEEYKNLFDWCDVFISHAGMGSIITALDEGKGIIICPRRYDLGEHRNNHQMSTLKKFEENPLVKVANNGFELKKALVDLKNKSFQCQELKVEESLACFLYEVVSEALES